MIVWPNLSSKPSLPSSLPLTTVPDVPPACARLLLAREARKGASRRGRSRPRRVSARTARCLPRPPRQPPAKRAPKRPAKATAKAVAEGAAAPSDPEAFIRQTVAAAEPEGIALSVLGKRVRGKFRTFKLRDLGYAQFRPYLDDLDGIKVEQRDGQSYARLDR